MSESLLAKLKRTTRLPSPPGAALQILHLCQKPEVDIGELVDTLAADPALSLRLLKYANSAILGANHPVTSVREAVVRLGVRSVRLMALSFSLVSADDPRACKGFEYQRFWAHSVACAVVGRALARRIPGLATEEAFAAGLLAHIGKLVFAVGIPDSYPAILAQAGGTLGATEKLEAEQFGVSHHDLGAELILDWGIPQRLADAVRFQTHPSQAPKESGLSQLAAVIGMATMIADLICDALSESAAAERWTLLITSACFKDEADARSSVEQMRQEFKELAAILSLNAQAGRSTAEIQAEAAEVLGELTLAAQIKTQQIEQEKSVLQKKAWTDGLTGIANRAAFDARLAELWDQAVAKGTPIALVLLDVDHFKKFNDTHGHQTGDAVLKVVASCLQPQVRSVDFIARYGGEEFAAILPNADQLTAAQICVKIRKAIEAATVECDGKTHKVTASVGGALLPRASRPLTPQLLIRAADKQLYVSKQKGRNCCSMTQLQSTVSSAPALAAAH